jgi:hypothetical protein
MKRAFQITALDEEIINEELPSHVDGDHFRWLLQIWHNHWFGGALIPSPWWPNIRQHNPIVEGLRHTKRREQDKDEKENFQHGGQDSSKRQPHLIHAPIWWF